MNNNNQSDQKPEPQANQDAWARTGGEFASGPAKPKVPAHTGTSGPSTPEQEKIKQKA